MSVLWQDLKYAVRTLRRSPGFAALVILTLALGIGANTAIFSVVNTVLLAHLPYRDPSSLVMVWGNDMRGGTGITPVSPAVFETWKADTHIFESVGASTDDLVTLRGGGDPEIVNGYDLSFDYLQTLGVKAELGRTFLAEEDRPGAPSVVLLSDRLWRRRFAADPNIVGKTINADGKPATVVGVMPPDFRYPERVEIWKNLAMASADFSDWNHHYVRVLARLAPGITHEKAQSELKVLAERLAREHPDTNSGEGVVVSPLRTELAGDIRTPLLILLGAVGFVLIIACVNVANLFLARATTREKEVAVRMALGAGRWRLVRQMLTESALLTACGGVLGLLLAYWSTGFLLALFPNNIANLNIPSVESISVDGRVLAFTFCLTVLTCVAFGIVPALRSSQVDINGSLKAAGSAGGSDRRFKNLLVVTEIALSFLLLIGAGLLVKSFFRVMNASFGFAPEHVVALEVFPSPDLYTKAKPEKLRNLVGQSIENLRAIPGAESASAINFLPLTGFWTDTTFTIAGRAAPPKGQEPSADNEFVAPGYFATLGIALERGRDFKDFDGPDSAHVAIISASLARKFWKGENPIGQRLNLGTAEQPNFCEIVGVAGDVHSFGLEERTHDEIYRPFSQVYFPAVAFAVRTKGDPAQAIAAAKAAIWKVDADLPFFKIITMNELATESTGLRRTSTILLSVFSSLALILAAVGVYGVISNAVAQRTHEIGIRTALGARPGDVMRLVLGNGLRLIVAGLGIGLVAAFWLTQLMASYLYNVAPMDALTFAEVSMVEIAFALLACYVPARRAMRVDPIVALRHE